jgi:zinc transporter
MGHGATRRDATRDRRSVAPRAKTPYAHATLAGSSIGVPAAVRDVETYGSDKDGLVCGFLFAPGEPARVVDASEAAKWLEAQPADETDWFLWLHFSTANTASDRWIQHHLALPDAFLEAWREPVASTRIEQAEQSLVAVLHDVVFDSAYEESSVSSVALCVEPRFTVTARRAPLRAVDRLRLSVKAGETFGSAVDLFAHLLRDQADVLVDIVRHATTRVNVIEDKLLARRVTSRRAELGAIRRTLVRLQRILAPEPAALFRLLSRPPQWMSETDLQELRQSAEEFSTAAADCNALVERVKLLQEELAAHVNEQNNRILFLLTLVTVLALPFNVVGSLFGMNVGGIPWAEDSSGFWIIVWLVTAFTMAIGALLWRRRTQ